jgi:ATP-dependent RNA circularization protein (DNA/RNA ligase family)
MTNNVIPSRVLSYKTYNSIGHLPNSRTGIADSRISEQSAKQMVSELPNQQSLVIVQEKIDGSNVCVVRHSGELITLGRSGFPCKDSNQEQHRMFDSWVKVHKDKFEKLLPNESDRVVGEWIALAHGTKYTIGPDGDYEQPFIAFDLFNGSDLKACSFIETTQRVYAVGLIMPKVIHIGGACSVSRALKILTQEVGTHAEGVVYRLEEAGKLKTIAKFVKHDKVDGLFMIDRESSEYIWNWRL